MNAVLRIFVWLLALSVVALPVVAVVNGWVGAERWPLAKLRVHGEFKRVPAEQLQQVLLPCARRLLRGQLQDAGRTGKLLGGKRAGAQAVMAGRAGSDPGRALPFARWGNDRLVEQGSCSHAEEAGRPGVAPELDGPDSQTEE